MLSWSGRSIIRRASLQRGLANFWTPVSRETAAIEPVAGRRRTESRPRAEFRHVLLHTACGYGSCHSVARERPDGTRSDGRRGDSRRRSQRRPVSCPLPSLGGPPCSGAMPAAVVVRCGGKAGDARRIGLMSPTFRSRLRAVAGEHPRTQANRVEGPTAPLRPGSWIASTTGRGGC